MALNIKSEEAHKLAKELAAAQGTTMTDAVIAALSRTLAAEDRSSDPEVLLAEVADLQALVAALPDRDTRSPDEILGYDEHGLPR